MAADSKKMKEQAQELLSQAAPLVLADYIEALSRPDVSIEDLRKGAVFVVNTLGLGVERNTADGLPVFNITIGGGVGGAVSRPVVLEMPEDALPVEGDSRYMNLPVVGEVPVSFAAMPEEAVPADGSVSVDGADTDDILDSLLASFPDEKGD